MSAEINVTDDTFQAEVKENEKLVLVDFWATWCGPCLAQGPTLEKIADEMTDKVTIAKLDVDQNQKTAMEYAVQSIPTLVLIKNGEEVERKIGLQSEEALKQWIESHA